MFDWLKRDVTGQSKFGKTILSEFSDSESALAAQKKLHIRSQKQPEFSPSGRSGDSIWRNSKSFKKSQSGATKDARPAFQWAEMVARIGEEIGGSLSTALEHLQQPLNAASVSLAIESIEQAKRSAMIAQKFAHLRTSASGQQAETLDLREVIREVVTQRKQWMQKNSIKARMGLVSASVYSDPAALFSLVDELVNWAGNMSKEIGFSMEEDPHNQRARLHVFARVEPASIPAGSWENAGWFLWHQLARTLGAKAELKVLATALSVSVTFPVPPPPDQRMQSVDLGMDAEIGNMVKGCRVVVITADDGLREQAFRALNKLELDLKTCWSVDAAREALGNSVPHAVVYDGLLDAGQIMQMRNDFSPRGKVAFIELTQTGNEDFSVTELGSLSTAHVNVSSLAQSLAPALIFELCKIL